MIANRQTDQPGALRYLDVIQRGSTEEWRQLYQLCRDPAVARAVAALLPLRDPDLMPSARLWRFLLEDLHPELQLRIDLHEEDRAIGV